MDTKDFKLTSEKLIQCYNTFVVKYREKCYKIIENRPERADIVKKNMILHNIYSLRMNVDIAFKKYMMKQLYQALQSKINKDSIKKLLFSMLDELEQSSEQFFDILSNDTKKYKIDLEPLINHINELIKYLNESIEKSYYKKQVEFLKILLEKAEPNTSLSRALEDLVIEYETGIFISRYFKEGEVLHFKIYNFNPYIILLLEHRIEDMRPVFQFSAPLLYLIPEYYLNHLKICELLFEVLDELFELPPDFTIRTFSILSLDLMSVLMAIIFEQYDYDKKLKILGDFYKFDIKTSDIITIAENIGEFLKVSFIPEEIRSKSEILELGSNLKDIWMIGKIIYYLNLPHFNILIYSYLYENETNDFYKTLALDNIATANRDMGKLSQAINLYGSVISYYEKNKLNYRKFIAMKNIAYCYNKSGEVERTNAIFKELEDDFSMYSNEELIGVYINLANRYRLTYQFEKEEYYLNLALEKLDIEAPNYFDLNNRLLEIGEFFDLSKGALDNDALKKLEIKRTHEKNKNLAYTHLNNYSLELCEIFLQEAYKVVNNDKDYWKILSNLHILKEEWEELIDSSGMILKQDSNDTFGHLYSSIYYIFKKNNPKILFHLLKIELETTSLNPLPFAQISRAISFICLNYDEEEIKDFIKFAFSKKNNNFAIINLLLIFAVIFASNHNKELSGFIYKNYMDIDKSQESMMLYAGWCYRFKDYMNSKHFYEKALSISPNDLELLEHLSHVCLMLNEFEESMRYIEKILSLLKPEFKEPYEKERDYVILIRDMTIRYENIPFSDVRIIFSTVEHELKELNPSKDIEFGNIITEFSKGIENLLAKTIGKKIYDFIKSKYFPISQEYRNGNRNKNIRPINRLLLNFFDDPENNNPTLGNWDYIIKGTVENLDPQNYIVQEIYSFLKNHGFFDLEKLKLILRITDFFLDPRNSATHKKLYTKNEVENILRILTPLINELIPFLINLNI